MAGFTTELKVGMLTVLTVAGTVYSFLLTDDKPPGALQGYTLYATVPSAEGLYPSTQVKLAGVSVGSVVGITLQDGLARLELQMSGDMQLGVDSTADLRSEGVLGDKFVRVTPGKADQLLGDGDTIKTAEGGNQLEELQAKAVVIAANVDEITTSLKTLIADPALKEKIDSTLENLNATSATLRQITEANKAEVAIVAQNLAELSETLNRLAESTSGSINTEMAAIHEATRKVDETMGHVNAIAARIDAGEGTIGKLINDPTTIDQINSTVSKVDSALSDITGMQLDVTYDGSIYFGTSPDDPALGLTENPISGEMKNTLGLRVLPRPDYGYIIGLTSHPYGSFEETTHVYPDTGGGYTELVNTEDLRLTFQFMKRWGPAAFRFGMKEGGGGVGTDVFLAKDRLTLSADVYDFSFGSWPVLDGTPNLTVGARATPIPHMYLGGGLDNVLFNAQHGYVTGYVGFGFWFTDQDIKWIMSAVPLPG